MNLRLRFLTIANLEYGWACIRLGIVQLLHSECIPRGAHRALESTSEPNMNAWNPPHRKNEPVSFHNDLISLGGQRRLGLAAHVENGMQTGNDHWRPSQVRFAFLKHIVTNSSDYISMSRARMFRDPSKITVRYLEHIRFSLLCSMLGYMCHWLHQRKLFCTHLDTDL